MARPSPNSRIEDIERYRRQTISQPWAQGIDAEEVRQYLAGLEAERFPSVVYAKRKSAPYIQPRGGVPLFEAQRALTTMLDEAGADFIPLTIDSYTRQNRYEVSAQLLSRSEEESKNYLNGYPLISHGYQLTRELYRGLRKPISLRHGTPDARLLAEVAIAAGIVEIEGGGICYCLPYSEGFPLDRSLLYWQYVDRVCAIYSTADRPIHRESFGPLTATLVPPAVVVVVQVLEALLAAEQGVSSLTVSFGQTGSPEQDVATAQVLRELTRHYLDTFDFHSVQNSLAFHQWMGQFPTDRPDASALIACSAQLAITVGADKVVVKTVDEALGVPDPEANAEAVRSVRYVFDHYGWIEPVTSPSIEAEKALIRSEAESILETIFDLPGDALWESVFQAFQRGFIDVPFSPHADNANRLVSIRDVHGAIRISDRGNVPIAAADMKREREMLASRMADSNSTFGRLISDINLMS